MLATLLLLLLPQVPPGEVAVPRLLDSAHVDGVLDEPVWAQAARLSGFNSYVPVDGRPAADSTEVFLWYGPTDLYVGVRAYEIHGEVRATLADRDKIQSDDYVVLVLDPFNDQRLAVAFGINPFGVQADGILSDAVRSSSAFHGSTSGGNYAIDLNPDYVFESKGRLTEFGFEIEVRIPFKSLRYQSAETQTWGFNVIRQVQHSGYQSTWTTVLQAKASFLAQSGRLVGLTDLRRGLVLDFNPELTSSVAGSDPGSGWTYGGGQPEIGGNVRWGVSNNLVLNGTVNPDFSQVEADVAQISYDPRNALFFPEKRPFFLDGIENFSTPMPIIYTRRVADPLGAVKLSGKVSGSTVGFMSAVDRKSTSFTGDDVRAFNLLRMRKDLGGQSTIGLAYTDLMDGDNWNRVASVDGRMVFGGIYSLTYQASGSLDHRNGTTTAAPLWHLGGSASGRRYGMTFLLHGIHGNFRARSGFVTRVGIAQANVQPRITLFGTEGSAIERWTGSINLDGIWDYDRFTRGTEPNDAKLHFNSTLALRGGWSVVASLLVESFKYPPDLYGDYWVERHRNGVAVDTVRFVGTDRLNNLDGVISIGTPRFHSFSGSLFALYGRDENFYEWAPSDIIYVTLTANWTPSEQLRVYFQYNHQQFIRPDDRSNVGIRRIPRLKVEYQLSRALFVRLVAQYDAYFQDRLRDHSRTDDPILLLGGDGVYRRTAPLRSNDLRVDWLLSYRPTPGTVLFLGYGSSLDEPDSFRLRNLERLNDGFFLKLSYLFRV